jgi:hypothetical protein
LNPLFVSANLRFVLHHALQPHCSAHHVFRRDAQRNYLITHPFFLSNSLAHPSSLGRVEQSQAQAIVDTSDKSEEESSFHWPTEFLSRTLHNTTVSSEFIEE